MNFSLTSRPPLTDDDGEVRELTVEDLTAFRPAREALPTDVQESVGIRRRGPQRKPTKVPVTMRLDADLLDALRESGPGWQTRLNDILRVLLAPQVNVNLADLVTAVREVVLDATGKVKPTYRVFKPEREEDSNNSGEPIFSIPFPWRSTVPSTELFSGNITYHISPSDLYLSGGVAANNDPVVRKKLQKIR